MTTKERLDVFGGLISLKQWHVVAIVAFLISAAVFVVSIILFFSFPTIIENNIRQSSILTRDSSLFEKWLHPDYSVTTQMSVFSVQNPDDVLNNSIPQLKQIGPYVFDQKVRRVVHSMTNGTVEYETLLTYFFNEEKSCLECFLHNRIWVPNLIYQKFVEAASRPTMKAASAALFVQTPFLEVEVTELLFDGYTDPFLDQVCTIPFVNFICESILNLPEKIGFFYKKNESSNGMFVVEDGAMDGGESLGKIVSWNGQTKLPDLWWDSADISKIRGNDGTLFKPYITPDDNLTVFVPELCRSLTLVFSEEFDYHGIPAYKFVVAPSEFDFTLKDNVGYCNKENSKEKKFFDQQRETCLPNGLLDISRCQKGEPSVVISLPNFLYAPKFVRDSVSGQNEARPENDQIEVLFEPRLGAVLEARRRFQINVAMWRGVDLPELANFRSSIVPVVRIDETVRIDSSNLETIKTKLIYLEEAVTFATAAAAIFSIVSAVLVVLYVIHRKNGSPVKQYIKRTFRRKSERVTCVANGNSANVMTTGVSTRQSEC